MSLERPYPVAPTDQTTGAGSARDQALDWFVRLQNSTEPGDIEAFARWREDSVDNDEAYAELTGIWDAPEVATASSNLAKRQGGLSRHFPMAARSRMHRPNGHLKMFGATAALLVLVIGLLSYTSLLVRWQADYITATGERKNIVLPDGSTMLLNTASAVALDFDMGRREVRVLDGEAWFDVVHDPAHPFRVTARYGEAEVKGTSFSVRSEDGEDSVILERGRVDVIHLPNRQNVVELHPGEMVEAKKNALSSVRSADAERDLAWREGRLVFQAKPFGAAIRELARYYGGSVLTLNSRSAEVLVSGNYRLDDAETAIRSLADIVGAKLTRLPGGLIILR